MTVKVHITEVASGETRIHDDPFEWRGDYVWRDGNYSCDCNRSALFARAGGEEPPDIVCGEHRFRVAIFDEDGNQIYADDRGSSALN